MHLKQVLQGTWLLPLPPEGWDAGQVVPSSLRGFTHVCFLHCGAPGCLQRWHIDHFCFLPCTSDPWLLSHWCSSPCQWDVEVSGGQQLLGMWGGTASCCLSPAVWGDAAWRAGRWEVRDASKKELSHHTHLPPSPSAPAPLHGCPRLWCT